MVIPPDPNAPVAFEGVDEDGGLNAFAERDAERSLDPREVDAGAQPPDDAARVRIEAVDEQQAADLLLMFPSEQTAVTPDDVSPAYVVRVRADVDPGVSTPAAQPPSLARAPRDASELAQRRADSGDDQGKMTAPGASGAEQAALRMLHDLCASIDHRLTRTEEAIRRTEGFLSDRTLQQMSARINVRLAETQDDVRRIEQLVVGGTLQELSTSVERRFRQTDEALRRIERMLQVRNEDATPHASRAWIEARYRLAAVGHEAFRHARTAFHWLAATAPDRGALGKAPHMTRRVVPACVLLAAAVVTMVRSDPATQTAPALVPEVTAEAQTVRPPAPPAEPAQQSPAPVPLAEPATRAASPATPAATSPSPQYVGTLSITSEPSGATVFINGRPAGVTPLTLSGRRAGSLALQIAREGFERWTAGVQVSAGRVTNVNARLSPSNR